MRIAFVDYAFENDGSASIAVVKIEGNTWTSVGSRTDSTGKTYQTKSVSTISDDGKTGSARVEYSEDGGKTWRLFFELTTSKDSE